MKQFIASQITAGYGKQSVINNISFSVDAGSLTGILGANGSGKTTLLKSLCGILPHTGNCRIDEIELEELSPRRLAQLCSYIPQRSGISIDISVLDVVLMGFNPHLGLLEHPTPAMKAAACEALSRVGLAHKEHTNYLHLSEGQKQLCILARTFVTDSPLLLLDEPESALDFRFRHKMLSLLQDYVSGQNRAALVTLHDPTLALNYCDRLLLLAEGSVLGVLNPKTDALDRMEQLLRDIYGSISLQRCVNRSGQTYLMMIKEDDE